MKVNFWCRLGIITKQGCVETALMLSEQITGMLPLGTLSFFTFQRQKSAYMRAGVMRYFHMEASVRFLWQYILICRIMLTLIVTCVLFILIPSLFRLLLVFGEHAGIWNSLKQHIVVCDICSASLQKKKVLLNILKV